MENRIREIRKEEGIKQYTLAEMTVYQKDIYVI